VIAVIAYAGWYRFSAIESGTTAVVQPVPARLAHLAEKPAEPSIPPASGPDGARVVAATPSPDPEATKPVVAAPPVPSPTPLPSKEAMGPPVPPVIAKQFAASAATPQLAAAANLGAPPAAPTLAPQVLAPPPSAGSGDGPRLQVKAISESWVQVREKQGGVLLNRVLRSGETWPVPSDKGPLLMTTGNAGGTALIVDGAAQAPLGPDGAVRRDIPLDLASLGDPKAGAAPLTDPAGPPPRPGPVSRTN
jgi:cytoskeleton protein RodZ